ncbi:MAG: ATP-binding cassette domain-containing protein [Streptococcaceae bacterium]|jgi:putative ABC transport system ATP-binding protein|nr:ATP-binding cassette domain-containing protein [Streptococcaceae bacterium]
MIEIINVTKKFGKKVIYSHVNLFFETGKSYALTGKSGSGKTTLLNCLARLDRPTEGEVLVDSKNIWKMTEKDFFKNKLGYIFQNYALIDDATVSKNLSVIEKNHQKQVEALERVGLDETFLSQKIYELSGGQAQRVAIARILLKKATVILADEPTGALDKETSKEVREVLLSLVTPEVVLIFATHDSEIYDYVDEIIDISKFSEADNEKEN